MKRYIYLGIMILLLGFGFFGIIENSKATCCISLPSLECRTPNANGSCSDPLAVLDPSPLSCTALDALYEDTCSVIIHAIPSPPPSATTAPITTLVPSGPYTLLESIPGFSEAEAGDSISFPAYVMAIYKFGLWAIGLCAMIMIMIGGYMYLTSAGNTSGTGKAKEVITDAIIGLILALTSYLLLYIINPDLIRLNF